MENKKDLFGLEEDDLFIENEQFQSLEDDLPENFPGKWNNVIFDISPWDLIVLI